MPQYLIINQLYYPKFRLLVKIYDKQLKDQRRSYIKNQHSKASAGIYSKIEDCQPYAKRANSRTVMMKVMKKQNTQLFCSLGAIRTILCSHKKSLMKQKLQHQQKLVLIRQKVHCVLPTLKRVLINILQVNTHIY